MKDEGFNQDTSQGHTTDLHINNAQLDENKNGILCWQASREETTSDPAQNTLFYEKRRAGDLMKRAGAVTAAERKVVREESDDADKKEGEQGN